MAQPITLADIEQLTVNFADARNQMMALGDALNVDLEAVRQAHLPTLTKAAHEATKCMNALYDTVKANPHLFEGKGAKSKIFAGIKVGLQSSKAKTTPPEDVKAFYIKLAETNLELADRLVKVEYSARQQAFNSLDADELVALELERTDGKDTPLVKPVDEAAAKIIDALIKEFVAE